MPADSSTIVFIRHGQALGVDGRCIGHTDVPLAPAGATAIRTLVTECGAAWLAGSAKPPRLVSSDLRRALDSAAIVSGVLGQPVDVDRRLREMDFGEWEGRDWTEIERTDGDRLRAWMERWTTSTPPDGERLDDLARRAGSWLGDVVDAESCRGRAIVVVSHAGFIRAAVSRLLGRPLASLFDLPIDHAHATVVQAASSGCFLVASNSGPVG